MPGRTCSPLLLTAALLTGCVPPPTATPPDPSSRSAQPSHFDGAAVGTLRGQVVWGSDQPVVAPFRSPLSPMNMSSLGPTRDWPNPNAPLVDPASRGLQNVVVYLRGVDPTRARPWDLPPVEVEFRDRQLAIHQGDETGHSGFVRRGDTFMVVAHDAKVFHSLRGEGAERFMLPFPDAEQPRSRRVDRAGIVELSSGAGLFWMRGHLFVVEHPYYTHTDATGHFTLRQVPEGEYDLVCWLPDWREASHEIDADSWLLSRLRFRPPVETMVRVRVKAAEISTVDRVISLADFPE